MKYLDSTWKNRIPKVKNGSLELEKDFKPIDVSIDDIGKSKEKQITKKRTFAKNTWYNWHDWFFMGSGRS